MKYKVFVESRWESCLSKRISCQLAADTAKKQVLKGRGKGGCEDSAPEIPGKKKKKKKRPSVFGLSCSSLLLTHRIVPRSVLPARGFILVSGTRNTGRHHHPPSVTVRTRTAATQQPATHRGNIQALLMSWSQNTEEKKDDHFPNTLCYHFVTTTSLQGPRRERAVLTFTSWTASTTK